jgi:hypothetical protein
MPYLMTAGGKTFSVTSKSQERRIREQIMSDNKPICKVVARHKTDGTYTDLVVVWPPKGKQRGPSPQIMWDNLRLVYNDQDAYYINFQEPRSGAPAAAAPPPAPAPTPASAAEVAEVAW